MAPTSSVGRTQAARGLGCAPVAEDVVFEAMQVLVILPSVWRVHGPGEAGIPQSVNTLLGLRLEVLLENL